MTKKFTKQETFDMICEGLKAQGWRKSGRQDSCKYRGPRGLKCAVGVLLADDEYDPLSDDTQHPWGIDKIVRLSPSLQTHDINLLDAAQGEHDSSKRPSHMKSMFRQLAISNGLEWKYD